MHKINYHTPKELKQLVNKEKKEFSLFFKQLRQMKSGEVNALFHPLHNEAFEQFNCLDCANCCSGISPIILQADIDQIARHLKIKPGDFIQQFLYMDEDGDFVFQQTPCPFLGNDNYCSIYESRPKACREYPHTNHKKMKQILDITEKNCEYCPVVYSIVKTLKNKD